METLAPKNSRATPEFLEFRRYGALSPQWFSSPTPSPNLVNWIIMKQSFPRVLLQVTGPFESAITCVKAANCLRRVIRCGTETFWSKRQEKKTSKTTARFSYHVPEINLDRGPGDAPRAFPAQHYISTDLAAVLLVLSFRFDVRSNASVPKSRI